MARYRKIEVKTWGDIKFRSLSPLQPSGQALWFYLIAGPRTTAIPGLFSAGPAAMAEDLDWDIKAFHEAFQEVLAEGMVKVDFKAKLVFLPKAVEHNKPESPNVVVSWGKEFELIPECELKIEAYNTLKAFVSGMSKGYKEAFEKAFNKPSFKSSRKTMPNQEQEQEQEQEQDIKDTLSSELDANAESIFSFWCSTMDKQKSAFSKARKKNVIDRLKEGYSIEEIQQAIVNCSNTPHNMGQNENRKVYDDIELICRSPEKLEQFRDNAGTLNQSNHNHKNEEMLRRFLGDQGPDMRQAS